MENYKPNSHKFNNEEREKRKKIVSGEVKRAKKNESTRLKDMFISEDAKNVKSYVLKDVIVPGIKKLISDVLIDSIQMIFGGGPRRDASNSRVSYVSYNNYSNRNATPVSRVASNVYSFDRITIDNRGEAEDVLAQLDSIIEKYGMASVTDFYDLVGVTGNYTDNKYGWTNLSSAKIVRTTDGGYFIDLPRAMPID